MARAGPPPLGGPDMATSFLLFYAGRGRSCHRATVNEAGALRIKVESGCRGMDVMYVWLGGALERIMAPSEGGFI
jgi:hypothetical protein